MTDGPADNLQKFPQQIQRMLDHYRLVDNPFGKAVNAKVFSRVGNRAEVASQIERRFRSTAAECLLIAPSEGGKRTLARQIVKQLGGGWRVAWVDGWEILDFVDLVRELCGQLRLGHEIDGTSVEESPQVAELVARKAEDGENCLLIVQHADQLTPDTQRWLHSLGRHGGRPEMRLRQLWLAESAQPIEQADEEHQWTATSLDPMTDTEALEYLGDRFAAAGRFQGLPIETEEVARLNQIAGGWPGRLNRVVRDYLVARTKTPLEWRPPVELLYALIAIAVLAAASALAVRYLSTQSGTNTADMPAEEESGQAREQAGIDPAIDEPDDASQPSASETEPVSTSARVDEEVAPAPGEESPDAETATLEVEPTPPDDDAGMEDAGDRAERNPTADEPDDGGEPSPSETEPASTTASGDDAIAAASGGEAPDTGTATADAEPTLPDGDAAGIEDAGDRVVFTVQLAGARDRDSLAALRDDLDAGMDMDIARTTLEGRPWYVLIAGRHDSVAQAREAIAALPPELRSRSPWPRPLSEIEVLDSAMPMIRVPPDTPDEDAATGEQEQGDVSAANAAFTLQVIGVRDRGSLEALIADLDEPEQYEIVSTTLEGRPWYVLTHGRYETVEAARSAIGRLPEELEQYSPWPRRLSDLQ